MPTTTVEVRGIPIQFPLQPYGCQVEYMSSVIDALNNNNNALLESPTGTGKTLSLLCSVMGWARHQETHFGKSSKVYYTSRTHTQLKQVMREYRKTEYGKIRIGATEENENASTIDETTLLGSRDQLCIHPRAIGVTSSTRNTLCKSIRENKECRYHERLDSFMQKGGLESCYNEQGDDPKGRKEGRTLALDIEDLAAAGRAHNFCPFYYTRKKAQTSKLTFMPYNYIIDPVIRKTLDIKLEEAIIIIDEAHNIADNISDSASFQVNTIQLANSVSELERASTAASKNKELSPPEAGLLCTEFDSVSQKIIKLISWIEHLTKKSGFDTKETPLSQPGKVILSVLSDMGLTAKEASSVRKALSELTKEAEGKGTKLDRPGLESLLSFLEGVYRYDEADLDQYFVAVIFEESNRNLESRYVRNNIAAPSVLGLWCMDPGVAMRRIMRGTPDSPGPRSVLITSGTMTPLEHFAAELGIPFNVQLQSTHVITRDQLFPLVVTSYDSVRLQSSYQNRKSSSYLTALGKALNNIFTTVPDGVLIFFQSFAFMKEVITAWKKPQSFDQGHTVYDVLLSKKYIFEEGSSSEAQTQLREYRSMLDEGAAAAIFAVFRGKMAEGMDFPDKYARAVCLCGVPYAALGDSKVKLKRDYLDRKHANRPPGSPPTISGSAWYQLNAVRALNQAVGRVIRHAGDYGAVFLLDDRYDSNSLKSQLPSWVGGHMKTTDSLQNMGQLLRSFYNMNALNASGRTAAVVSSLAASRSDSTVVKLSSAAPANSDSNAAEAVAFINAHRYDEALARDPEVKRKRLNNQLRATRSNIKSNWGVAPAVHEFNGLAGGGDSSPTTTVKKGLASKIGSAASNEVLRYQIPEYKDAVTKMFSLEEVNIWKGLLKEFCEIVKSRGEVTDFLSNRFVPWCCDTMQRAGASNSFIRSQVIFLPPSTKEPYLKAVTAYIGRIRKRKDEEGPSTQPSPEVGNLPTDVK
eukprot:TRINITY_DN4174_c0_g2_i1.p1 TRINITY_DN4174_c0_g2~~TRINITY_DN4174_c0_g2_i1.p1  ORF type:complete len:1006 (+),score=194.33 TRINITY_DN4174_c0_g2_i1:92-3019(+)